MKQVFLIEGMTCGGCVSRVQSAILAVPSVQSVHIDLANGQASVLSAEKIAPAELRAALAPMPHYHIMEPANSAPTIKEEREVKGAFQKFWPLILIGLFLLVISCAVAWDSPEPMKRAMEVFMGGFFLAFSFFKFLDLRGFVRSFSRYDLLAKRSSLYAWIYPFLELALGFGWGFAGGTFAIALLTLLLMGFGAIGVIRAVRQKQAIQCACLGTVFQLPMTRVTIIEDLLMVIMSLFFLIPF